MPAAPPPSGAVTIGYRLVTLMLLVATAFLALELVSIIVGIARGGDSLLHGDPLTVPLQANPEHLRGLPPSVHLNDWPNVDVEISDPSIEVMVLRSAVDLPPLALLISVLWLLGGLVGSVRAAEPFGEANVRRLRTLGAVLVAGGLAAAFAQSLLRLWLFDVLPPDTTTNLAGRGFEFPGGAVLAGLGAYILAEAFAYGLRLREDAEGTI
jgi:Protein of unknown function (DUF2975)